MNGKKTKPAVAIGLIVFLVTALLVLWNPLQVVQWKLSDLLSKKREVGDQITIIAIDEKSLSPEVNLGRFKDWPRSYYSQMLRAIKQHKPAVVGFDLDFKETSRGMSDLRLKQLLRDYELKNSGPDGMSGKYNPDWYKLLKKFEGQERTGEEGEEAMPTLVHPDDKDLQDAMLEIGSPVVLASTLVSSGSSEVFAPIFGGANITSGFANVLADKDGVLRKINITNGDKKSFSLAIAQAFNKDLNVPDATSSMPINYANKPFSFKMIPFVDILAGTYKPSDIEGKIVLVGATARVIQDFQVTPGTQTRMPGVEVHANLIQQFLDGKYLSEQGPFGTMFFVLLIAVIGSVVMLAISLRWVGVAFAAVLFGFPILVLVARQFGFVLNVVYPETAWVFVGIGTLLYRNKTELRARREIKEAFSHYVSPIVVNELVKDPNSLKLGGNRKNISVLFSDIVGFTSFAEKLTPEDTVTILNDYLTSMTESVFEFHGTLDKYQGDAIMALFGAPLDDEHHAVNACHTALGMRKALVGLHERWNMISQLPFKDELLKLDFRVGIASGPAVVGNVGSERRFDYTAIGDIVNLGSRLESLNRKYGTHVIVDKGTFVAVTENHNPFLFRKLDTVRVKGKEKETEIFEVVAVADSVADEVKTMLDDFENGRILYTQRNFLEAKQYFESAINKVPGDGPSQIYINRCNFFIRKPPSRDWNPIVDLAEK